MGAQSSKDLYDKILEYDRNPETFKQIMDNSNWIAKKRLGKRFHTWKIACLYDFLQNLNTDMEITVGPDVVSAFSEIEANIINTLRNKHISKEKRDEYQDLAYMLYLGTEDNKYLPYVPYLKHILNNTIDSQDSDDETSGNTNQEVEIKKYEPDDQLEKCNLEEVSVV